MVSFQAFLVAAALSGSGETVLLDFTADWCGPCRTMEPTIERLRDSGYPVRKVNVDQNPELARRYGVRPIPCFILVKDGREVDRIVGAASFDRLTRLFQQAGAGPSSGPAQGVRHQSPDHVVTPPNRLQPTDLKALPNAPLPGGAPVRSGAPARDRSAGLSGAAQQRALHATVRLRVVDATGQSHGTGTIIDTHGDEALVLTCGHIFRESNGQGEIWVELFAPGAVRPVPGHLLAFDAQRRDIGILSIRPGISVVPVCVAGPGYQPRNGERIFSIGCDHGADPTVRASTISAINRYAGPPNLEILGHPVEGRSGGGLFTADGRIIGICNAADLQEDRGIFAALPTIHEKLRAIGLENVYAQHGQTAPESLAGSRESGIGAATIPLVPTSATGIPQGPAGDTEVICIVRSRSNPRGESRVFVVDQPSPEFIERLARESQLAAASRAVPAAPSRHDDTARRQAPSAGRPVVLRAQGR